MRLAVYGTMKWGLRNHSRLNGSRFIERGVVYGYRMHSIGHAPALVADKRYGHKPTEVEIYEVPSWLVKKVIDHKEGVGSGVYRRTTAEALTSSGVLIRVQLYVMSNRSLNKRDHGKIADRVWREDEDFGLVRTDKLWWVKLRRGEGMKKQRDQIVFVYGTLRKGMSNQQRFIRDDQFMGTGQVGGFRLYDAGLPMATLGVSNVVVDVAKISEEQLERLDRLEGHPHFYTRIATSMTLGSETVWGWIYVVEYHDVSARNGVEVVSGDWVRYEAEEYRKRVLATDPESKNPLTPGEWNLFDYETGACGSFHRALFNALELADSQNFERLRAGFPQEAEAFHRFRNEEGYWDAVKRAASEYLSVDFSQAL